MKRRSFTTISVLQGRFLASASLGFVFSMLFLILPALGAQTETPTEKTSPATSDADPNAIASTPDGDSDVTELLTEDKKITQEDKAKAVEPPPPSAPSAEPNAIASPSQGGTDVTEILAEDKKKHRKEGVR